MKKVNQDIRLLAKSKGVTFWQVAMEIGIGESTLTRRMRVELSDDAKAEMERVILKISRGKGGAASENADYSGSDKLFPV